MVMKARCRPDESGAGALYRRVGDFNSSALGRSATCERLRAKLGIVQRRGDGLHNRIPTPTGSSQLAKWDAGCLL